MISWPGHGSELGPRAMSARGALRVLGLALGLAAAGVVAPA